MSESLGINVVTSFNYNTENPTTKLEDLFLRVVSDEGIKFVPLTDLVWIKTSKMEGSKSFHKFLDGQEVYAALEKLKADDKEWSEDKKIGYKISSGEVKYLSKTTNCSIYTKDWGKDIIIYKSNTLTVPNSPKIAIGMSRDVKLKPIEKEKTNKNSFVRVKLENNKEVYVTIEDLGYDSAESLPQKSGSKPIEIKKGEFKGSVVKDLNIDQFYEPEQIVSFNELNTVTLSNDTYQFGGEDVVSNQNHYAVEASNGEYVAVKDAEPKKYVKLSVIYKKVDGKSAKIEDGDDLTTGGYFFKEDGKEVEATFDDKKYDVYTVSASNQIQRFYTVQTPTTIKVPDAQNPGETKDQYVIRFENFEANLGGRLLKLVREDTNQDVFVDFQRDLFTDVDCSKKLQSTEYTTEDGDKFMFDGQKLVGRVFYTKIGDEVVKLQPLTLEQSKIRYAELKSYQPIVERTDEQKEQNNDSTFLRAKNGSFHKESDLVQPLYYQTSDESNFTHFVFEKDGRTYIVHKNEFNKTNKIEFSVDEKTKITLTKTETTPKVKQVSNSNDADYVQTKTIGEAPDFVVNSCTVLKNKATEPDARNGQIQSAQKEVWKNYLNKTFLLGNKVFDKDGNEIELEADKKVYHNTNISYANDYAHDELAKCNYRPLELSEENGTTTVEGGPKYDWKKGFKKSSSKIIKLSFRPALAGLCSGSIPGVFVVAPLGLIAGVAASVVGVTTSLILNPIIAGVKNGKEQRLEHKTEKNIEKWAKNLDNNLEQEFSLMLGLEKESDRQACFDRMKNAVARLATSRFNAQLEFKSGIARVDENNAAMAKDYIAEIARLNESKKKLEKLRNKLGKIKKRSPEEQKQLEECLAKIDKCDIDIDTLKEKVGKTNFKAHAKCAEYYTKAVKAKVFADFKRKLSIADIEVDLEDALKQEIINAINYNIAKNEIEINTATISDKKTRKAINKALTKEVKNKLINFVNSKIDAGVEVEFKFGETVEETVELDFEKALAEIKPIFEKYVEKLTEFTNLVNGYLAGSELNEVKFEELKNEINTRYGVIAQAVDNLNPDELQKDKAKELKEKLEESYVKFEKFKASKITKDKENNIDKELTSLEDMLNALETCIISNNEENINEIFSDINDQIGIIENLNPTNNQLDVFNSLKSKLAELTTKRASNKFMAKQEKITQMLNDCNYDLETIKKFVEKYSKKPDQIEVGRTFTIETLDKIKEEIKNLKPTSDEEKGIQAELESRCSEVEKKLEHYNRLVSDIHTFNQYQAKFENYKERSNQILFRFNRKDNNSSQLEEIVENKETLKSDILEMCVKIGNLKGVDDKNIQSLLKKYISLIEELKIVSIQNNDYQEQVKIVKNLIPIYSEKVSKLNETFNTLKKKRTITQEEIDEFEQCRGNLKSLIDMHLIKEFKALKPTNSEQEQEKIELSKLCNNIIANPLNKMIGLTPKKPEVKQVKVKTGFQPSIEAEEKLLHLLERQDATLLAYLESNGVVITGKRFETAVKQAIGDIQLARKGNKTACGVAQPTTILKKILRYGQEYVQENNPELRTVVVPGSLV